MVRSSSGEKCCLIQKRLPFSVLLSSPSTVQRSLFVAIQKNATGHALSSLRPLLSQVHVSIAADLRSRFLQLRKRFQHRALEIARFGNGQEHRMIARLQSDRAHRDVAT